MRTWHAAAATPVCALLLALRTSAKPGTGRNNKDDNNSANNKDDDDKNYNFPSDDDNEIGIGKREKRGASAGHDIA